MTYQKVPILVIAYRRHDLLRRLLDCLPSDRQILICIDGPRIPEHEPSVSLVRNLAYEFSVRHPSVAVLARKENIGGPIGIPLAIDWAFESVDQLLILEEDCIPSDLAFSYIDNISSSINANELIAGATLNNFLAARVNRQFDSPFLSIFSHIWGWFVKKDIWVRLRPDPESQRLLCSSDGRKQINSILRKKFPGDFFAQLYWRRIFYSLIRGYSYHWDYAFTLNLWISGMYFVAPPCNLVSNIGFDERSQNCKTKTANSELPVATQGDSSLSLSLTNNVCTKYSYTYFDRANQALVFNSGVLYEIKRIVSRMLHSRIKNVCSHFVFVMTRRISRVAASRGD